MVGDFVCPVLCSGSPGGLFETVVEWEDVVRAGNGSSEEHGRDASGPDKECMMMLHSLGIQPVTVRSRGLSRYVFISIVKALDTITQSDITPTAGGEITICFHPRLQKVASIDAAEQTLATINSLYPDVLSRAIIDEARTINDETMIRNREV